MVKRVTNLANTVGIKDSQNYVACSIYKYIWIA